MFRSLLGSSSGIHIKVTHHKPQIAMHVHYKKDVKSILVQMYVKIMLYNGFTIQKNSTF
jgi:hypothetical protein